MTNHEARALLMELRAYYTHDVPDETIMVMSRNLEQFDRDAAKQGLTELVESETDRWFPSWATIHRYVGRSMLGDVPTAEQAWDTVSHGSAYYAPKLNPITALAVRRLGGWERMMHAPIGDPWEKKRFVETYELCVAEAIRNGIQPVHLVGIMGSATSDGLNAGALLELAEGGSE